MARRFGIPRRISRSLNRRLLGLVTDLGLRSLVTLETQGRRTGRLHRVVLPVYLVSSHRMFAVSSYGRRSDWLKNVAATPRVGVTRGGQAYHGTARLIAWGELHRTLRGSGARVTSIPRWLRMLVRTVFLVRARISGTVVEITT
ncbi:MAG: nitroreductase family deazaflavin-dependent oxidoreductase [Thermoplasmata archaeon]